MCAVYGLDPRFADSELLDAADDALLDGLRQWAQENAATPLRPTGRHARNLNPLVIPRSDRPSGAGLQKAWWGFLVDGVPAKFPSINSRSERLLTQPGAVRTRGIVPATGWYEMQKPSRTWHQFRYDTPTLFGLAAITRPGTTPDGTPITCYSIIMRDAPAHLRSIHERVPVIVPRTLSHDWLTHTDGTGILGDILAASDTPTTHIHAHALTARP